MKISSIKNRINFYKVPKLAKDTLFQLSINVFTRLISLLNSIFAVKTLGSYNIGFSNVVQTTINQTSIIYDGNLNSVGIRKIIESKYSNLEIAYKIISLRFLVSFLVSFFWIIVVFLTQPTHQMVWFIGGLYIIVNALDLNFYFRSLSIYNTYIVISGLTPVLIGIFYYIFLHSSDQTGLDLVILFISSLITCFLSWLYIYFKKGIFVLKFYTLKEYCSVFNENKMLWYSSVIGIAYPAIQVYLIAYLLGLKENGVYKASFLFIVPLDMFITTFTGIILPKITEWKMQGIESYKKNVNNLFKKLLLFFPIIFISLSLISKDIFHQIVGNKYIFSFDVFRIVLMGKIIMIIFLPYTCTIIANRQDTYNLGITFIVLAVSLIMNFTLIPFFGINGAATTMLICDIIFPIVAYFKFSQTKKINY